MATSIPLPFKPQIPVTPPPDFQMFMKGFHPNIPPPFAQGLHQTPSSSLRDPLQPCSQHAPTTSSSQTPTIISDHPPGPCGPCGFLPPKSSTTNSNPNLPPNNLPPNIADPDPASANASAAGVDPRYIAMASRIASYYQQRCQAVANFQQQRCQAWANAQRQKCQEMMQAATVIVAWYIRDRISRRRKRQRRSFKRGLSQRAAGMGMVGREIKGERRGGGGGGEGRITRGESVRRWVMNVPLVKSGSGNSGVGSVAAEEERGRELPVDKEERDFDMDREVPADKDTQLFSVADNLIKSHLARIDVPLLGVLSFDESDSESESEYEAMDYEEEIGEEEEEYEDEEGGETGDGEEEDDDVVRDDIAVGRRGGRGGDGEVDSGSQHAQLGTTTKGSRKRSRSSIS